MPLRDAAYLRQSRANLIIIYLGPRSARAAPFRSKDFFSPTFTCKSLIDFFMLVGYDTIRYDTIYLRALKS